MNTSKLLKTNEPTSCTKSGFFIPLKVNVIVEPAWTMLDPLIFTIVIRLFTIVHVFGVEAFCNGASRTQLVLSASLKPATVVGN